MLTAAIIGCGLIGSGGKPSEPAISHAGAYRSHPKIILTAGADIDEKKLKKFGVTWRVKNLYTDYQEMLEKEKPELVSICTPTLSHFDIVCKVIKAKVKLVFLEKPATETLHQADELIALAQEYGTSIAVNYQRAWDKRCQEMVKYLKKQSLGAIQKVYGCYTGGTVHNGTHMFQIVNSVLGKPISVHATFNGHNNITATVEYHGEIRTIFSGYTNLNFSLHELDFIAKYGRYKYLNGGERIELWKQKNSSIFPNFRILFLSRMIENPGLFGCLNSAISDLLSCKGRKKELRCGLRESREALEIALAIEESLRSNGERVILPIKQT